MTTLVMDRDTGFCSGGDEDEGFYSHTDASDDSADVKVRGISILRNKRKCSEPRRLDTDLPAKKRKHNTCDTKSSPFRPWSGSPPPNVNRESPALSPPMLINNSPEKLIPWMSTTRPINEEKAPYSTPGTAPHYYLQTPSLDDTPSRQLVQQNEPLSLVSKKKSDTGKYLQRLHIQNRVPVGNERSPCERPPSEPTFKIDNLLTTTDRTSPHVSDSPKSKTSQLGQQQRNYKNMTRERRIEANARERTRVHTISAAFDTLRHSIPAYSHNQKLSKLSVLRIACSYIVTLSRLAGSDYSPEQDQPELAECVSNVSRTIQTEGKIRKKKDE